MSPRKHYLWLSLVVAASLLSSHISQAAATHHDETALIQEKHRGLQDVGFDEPDIEEIVNQSAEGNHTTEEEEVHLEDGAHDEHVNATDHGEDDHSIEGNHTETDHVEDEHHDDHLNETDIDEHHEDEMAHGDHEEGDHDDHDDHEDEHADHEEHDDHYDHDDHDDHDEADGDAMELESTEKPWGAVIGAALIINLVTLVGIVFVAGKYLMRTFGWNSTDAPDGESKTGAWKFTSNIIPSFACGALLATNVFLILPESLAMIGGYLSEQAALEGDDGHGHRLLEGEEEEDDIESAIAWRFGLSVLGGFLLPIAFSFIFPHHHEPDLCDECMATKSKEMSAVVLKNVPFAPEVVVDVDADDDLKKMDDSQYKSTLGEGCEDAGCHDGEHHCKDAESAEESSSGDVAVTYQDKTLPHTNPVNVPLAASILLGDFFHNFTDGVLVGTAFLLCDRSLAITISIATIYHELAQEIADFFLLTKHCNIKPCMALFLNFVCGLSVMFGAVLILAVEDITSLTTGCLLAIGGGVYLYIAIGECLPRARQVQKNNTDKAVSLVSFAVGVVPIGLVLINHGHCGAHAH